MPTLNTGNSIQITMYSRVQLPYEYGDLAPVLSDEAVREHYDFHYANYTKGLNDSIFFQSFKPYSEEPNEIPESLQKLMIRDFGSPDEFMNYFIGMGKRVFGSGWVWWCLEANGRTSIVTTTNQDTPYSQGLYPLFGIDVWEHSYYLDYKGDRLKYLNDVFQIVNWDFVIYRIKHKFNNNV